MLLLLSASSALYSDLFCSCFERTLTVRFDYLHWLIFEDYTPCWAPLWFHVDRLELFLVRFDQPYSLKIRKCLPISWTKRDLCLLSGRRVSGMMPRKGEKHLPFGRRANGTMVQVEASSNKVNGMRRTVAKNPLDLRVNGTMEMRPQKAVRLHRFDLRVNGMSRTTAQRRLKLKVSGLMTTAAATPRGNQLTSP